MSTISNDRKAEGLRARAVTSEVVNTDLTGRNKLGFTPSIYGLFAAGHSYLDNATPPGVQDVNGGLIQQLHRQLGIASSLSTIETDSGAQLSLSSDTAGIVDVLQGMATGATRTEAPYVPDIPAGLGVYGNNDLILWTADDAPVVTAWPHALRALISNFGVSRWFQHTDASIAYSGGSNVAATTQNKGSGYRSFTVAASTATWTVPSDFEGGVLQVWAVGRPSTNGGIFTVTIDGTAVDTFTTVGQGLAATPVPMVRRYRATAGAHTVVVTQSGTPSNGNFLNGFAIEATPFPAVVIANTPRWLQYNAPWGDVTDDKVRKLNALTETVLQEFPDSVVLYDLDDLIQRRPDALADDGAHLNDRGTALAAGEIKAHLLRAIQATGYPATWLAP